MTEKTKTRKSRRTARQLAEKDWEIAALEMIGETGLAGLAIEPLARRLGVTKGSFYWHFSGPDELIEACLNRWERVFTDGKYGLLEETKEPAERIRALFQDIASGDPALGVFHALSLEQHHPLVGPVFRRVASKRLRFLQGTLEELGLSRARARDRALILYSAYIGFLQTWETLAPVEWSASRRKRFLRDAFALLIPEAT